MQNSGTNTARRFLTDDEFMVAWREAGGSPAAMSSNTGIGARNIKSRAAKLRGMGYDLPMFSTNPAYFVPRWTYPAEMALTLQDGVILVASDLHMWPQSHQPRPTVQQVFLDFAHELKPDVIVFAGDVIDGTRISRHSSIRGQRTPTVTEEADAFAAFCRDMPGARHRYVTVGNHDLRIDNYLAQNANEMADWAGRLQDRTPGWEYAYSLIVNNILEIRHDWHNGIHAGYNNALKSGITCVTGHTHAQGVTPYRDRRGTRYGVQLGMLNDPRGPQWEYTHGRSSQARAGFGVLTFDGGMLLPPELCEEIDGRFFFRNRMLNKPRVRVAAVTG